MAVYQFFGQSVASNGKIYGFCFEHKAENLFELFEAARKDGLIYGERLRTVDDGRGRRMITSREPVVIGLSGIATIQNANMPHWEPLDEAEGSDRRAREREIA